MRLPTSTRKKYSSTADTASRSATVSRNPCTHECLSGRQKTKDPRSVRHRPPAKPETDLFEIANLLREWLEPDTEDLRDISTEAERVLGNFLDRLSRVERRLQEGKRRRPLLLKDIRKDLIAAEPALLPRVMTEFTKVFPAQRPADERIVACVVGIAAPR